MATTTKRNAVIVPTSIIKGALCVPNKGVANVALSCLYIRGEVRRGKAVNVDLHIAATNNTAMVTFHYSYEIGNGDPIDTPDEFEWVINPYGGGTLGKGKWCSIERVEGERGLASYTLRTFGEGKTGEAVARGLAIANQKAVSTNEWDEPAGLKIKHLRTETYDSSAYKPVANATFNLDKMAPIMKAITTAYGSGTVMKFEGINDKGSVLRFKADSYELGTVTAYLALMLDKKPTVGSIEGADPDEMSALQKAYDAQLEISQKLAAENAELKSELSNGSSFSDDYDAMELAYESKCRQVDELTAQVREMADQLDDCQHETSDYHELAELVTELNAELAAKEAENAELRSTWESIAKIARGEDAPAPEPEPEPEQVTEPEPTVVIEPESADVDHAMAFFVPDGCTVDGPNNVGNIWLIGPADVTKANAEALKADGWRWAKQRKQWWRKSC